VQGGIPNEKNPKEEFLKVLGIVTATIWCCIGHLDGVLNVGHVVYESTIGGAAL
jgi:hypothetical protein